MKVMGLGLDFLRHIERTRVIVHLIDILPIDSGGGGAKPIDALPPDSGASWRRIPPSSAAKPEILVANKMDLSGASGSVGGFAGRTAGASRFLRFPPSREAVCGHCWNRFTVWCKKAGPLPSRFVEPAKIRLSRNRRKKFIRKPAALRQKRMRWKMIRRWLRKLKAMKADDQAARDVFTPAARRMCVSKIERTVTSVRQ